MSAAGQLRHGRRDASRTVVGEPTNRPARAQAGRGPLLSRRLGISGAVITIMGVSAACLAVFGLALCATSLAF